MGLFIFGVMPIVIVLAVVVATASLAGAFPAVTFYLILAGILYALDLLWLVLFLIAAIFVAVIIHDNKPNTSYEDDERPVGTTAYSDGSEGFGAALRNLGGKQ